MSLIIPRLMLQGVDKNRERILLIANVNVERDSLTYDVTHGEEVVKTFKKYADALSLFDHFAFNSERDRLKSCPSCKGDNLDIRHQDVKNSTIVLDGGESLLPPVSFGTVVVCTQCLMYGVIYFSSTEEDRDRFGEAGAIDEWNNMA